MNANRVKRYVEKLFGRNGERTIFECDVCGCTYGSRKEECSECWNSRLVRIR